MGTAQRLGWQGRELVLCSAAPLLVRLLEILGWADVPGMVVVPRRPAAAPAGLRPAHARRLRPEPALTLRSA